MAFIRIDKKASGDYIRIVESYRDDDGKTKHRTLHQLGRVSDYSDKMLRRMGERLYELGGGEIRDLIGPDIEELGRFNYGFFHVYAKIFRSYGLDKVLGRVARRKKLKFDLVNVVMLMLLERLNDPASKRGNYFNQEEYLGIEPVGLQHLYRSLDHLADHQELIQNCIYQRRSNLFNQTLDVVFYDVTTFYFDSDKVAEGSIRAKGFSKDGKVGKTQILFGLLIDRHKQPIGYRIYRGDTYEGYTFEHALLSLKQAYNIDKVVVVADRGMLSKNNLALVTGNGYEFIVGERLRKLPKAAKEHLLNLDNYKQTWVQKETGEEQVLVRYCTLEYGERTIIGTYSAKRARKDAAEREEKLAKARHYVANPSQLKSKARRFFISTKLGAPSIDEDRVRESERYDGFLAITTSSADLPVEEVLDHYRNLYRIEHSFRTFKSHLETRPMFHWTDKRIEGHICLCYMAYTLLRNLQNTLEKRQAKFSEDNLRRLIERMQVSLVRQGDKEFYLRSKLDDRTRLLLNRLGKKPLPALIPKSQIISHL